MECQAQHRWRCGTTLRGRGAWQSLKLLMRHMSDMPERRGPEFAIPATVLYREVNGQKILLSLENEQYFELNDTSATIVDRITKEPLGLAISMLTCTYNVDPAVLDQDVRSLISALVEVGLLEPIESD